MPSTSHRHSRARSLMLIKMIRVRGRLPDKDPVLRRIKEIRYRIYFAICLSFCDSRSLIHVHGFLKIELSDASTPFSALLTRSLDRPPPNYHHRTNSCFFSFFFLVVVVVVVLVFVFVSFPLLLLLLSCRHRHRVSLHAHVHASPVLRMKKDAISVCVCRENLLSLFFSPSPSPHSRTHPRVFLRQKEGKKNQKTK